MNRRYKLLFIFGFALLAITSGFSVWALLQLQKEVQLRKQTTQLQIKLDDVLESLQDADNHFLSYRLTDSESDMQGLVKSIGLSKKELSRLKNMPGQTPEVRTAIHHLEVLVVEKFKFSESWEMEQDPVNGPRLRNSLQINDDVLVTDVVQEAMKDIDGFLEANLHEHQGFVDRYFSIVLFALALGSLIALVLLASFAYLVSAEISRRAQLERELRQAQDAAMVASNLKSQFLATVSHEIRTPLNGIIGMSDVLRSKIDQPDLKRYAEIMQKSGQTLLRIVNDILDFSKVEAGKLEFEIQEFRINDVLDSALELFSSKASEKGLTLFGLTDRRIATTVAGDAARISQILHNLIGNAVKFTVSGHVWVQVRQLSDSGDHTTIQFSVVDTGPGISGDLQPLLFQPFNQLHRTSQQSEGTGLGLSICKQLVERMNGQIGVKSELGKGSEFWFTVPLRKLSVPASTQKIPAVSMVKLKTNDVWDRFFTEYAKDLGGRLELAEDLTSLSPGADQPLVILDCVSGETNLPATPAERPVICTSRAPQVPNSHVPVIRSPVTATHVDLALLMALGIGNLDESPQGNHSPADVVSTTQALILLVEDNPTNQILAQTQLEQMGYRVHLVNNGRECLDALSRVSYDLVIMDCRMPVMDGYEATRQIRANEVKFGTRRLPVIAMTANAIEGDREKCLAAGMDDYLAKPIDYNQLNALVQKWVKPNLADIDWAVIRTLEEKTNREVIKKLIASFSSTLEKAQTDLAKAFDSSDYSAVGQLAHQIKSSAAALGAYRLSEHCRDLESAVDAGEMPDPALRQALMSSCKSVLDEMKSQRLYN